MGREIRLAADYKGQLKSVIWISLQDDSSISVGMSDRTFLIPGFISEIELDGSIYKSHVDLEGKYNRYAITNPHFTFHPPMYVHLRANKGEELFAGLLGVDFIVEEKGYFPWIRFISNPFRELKPFLNSIDQKNLEVVRLQIPSEDVSLGVAFDFVRQPVPSPNDIPTQNIFINWHGRTLQASASLLPAQKSTVQWNHES